MDFCTWKDLTQYNKIALVGIFRDGLNKGLARKLVEVGQLNETSSLDAWYFKAVEFERAKRSAEGIFGWERQFIDGKKTTQGEAKREDRSTLVVPRRDPNAMDIDMMRKQGMCFNCGVKGHIAARCPEPKKERKFFGRRIESGRSVDEMSETELREWVKEQIEGFGKGRE